MNNRVKTFVGGRSLLLWWGAGDKTGFKLLRGGRAIDNQPIDNGETNWHHRFIVIPPLWPTRPDAHMVSVVVVTHAVWPFAFILNVVSFVCYKGFMNLTLSFLASFQNQKNTTF